jgi:hypothetical protein
MPAMLGSDHRFTCFYFINFDDAIKVNSRDISKESFRQQVPLVSWLPAIQRLRTFTIYRQRVEHEDTSLFRQKPCGNVISLNANGSCFGGTSQRVQADQHDNCEMYPADKIQSITR